MKEELDKRLTKAFPRLYEDRNASSRSTAMCWGFDCSDGWFDIIWDLSLKLEPIIRKFIVDNPNLTCCKCGCDKNKHYGSKTRHPGKCLSIHVDPHSEEEPPGNYRSCSCDTYAGNYPKAAQVKEKFGGLRFYMTTQSDEISALIREAEALSSKTCQECGQPGESRGARWARTLCESCDENWGEIQSKKLNEARKRYEAKKRHEEQSLT